MLYIVCKLQVLSHDIQRFLPFIWVVLRVAWSVVVYCLWVTVIVHGTDAPIMTVSPTLKHTFGSLWRETIEMHHVSMIRIVVVCCILQRLFRHRDSNNRSNTGQWPQIFIIISLATAWAFHRWLEFAISFVMSEFCEVRCSVEYVSTPKMTMTVTWQCILVRKWLCVLEFGLGLALNKNYVTINLM